MTAGLRGRIRNGLDRAGAGRTPPRRQLARALLVFGFGAALAVAPTHTLDAQEPAPADTARPPAADPAQPAPEPGGARPDEAPRMAGGREGPGVARLAVTLSAGTLGFSELQIQPVLAERPEEGAGEAIALRRSLTAEDGYHVQASVLLNLTPVWGIRVGAGLGRATLRAEYGGSDDSLVEEARALPVVSESSIELVGGEAAVQLRLPAAGRFRPYAELGAAVERWSLDSDESAVPATETLVDEPVIRVGPQLAVGAAVSLTERLDGRLQLGMRYVRTPLAAASGGVLAGNDSLRLTLVAPVTTGFADSAVELTRVMRLEAGLSLRLGTARAEPSGPAGSAGAPSGSRR